MTASTCVAITGAAGYLGRISRSHLRARFSRLNLLDLAAMEAQGPHENLFQGDLADTDLVREALEGSQVVVHLGANLSVDSWPDILSGNIVGTYNVYQAARDVGAKRVIFASSHHVSGMYPSHTPIDLDQPSRPDSLYGVSKSFGETLGRYFWDKFGLESVALRIGSARAAPGELRERYTWLSEPDYCRLLDAAIDAPSVGFTAVWGVSDNDATWWDNRQAQHLGFAPRDNAADHLLPPAASNDPFSPLLKLQGGKRALYNLKHPEIGQE